MSADDDLKNAIAGEVLLPWLRGWLKVPWRERLVRDDPRREFRKWEVVRIFRAYQQERNRYGVDAVPIVHAARQCGRTMMLREVENLYRLEHPNATVVHVYPGVDGARVEVTVTPGEYNGPDVSIVAGLAWRGSLPDDPAILYFGEAKKEPETLEPLATPPWEKA